MRVNDRGYSGLLPTRFNSISRTEGLTAVNHDFAVESVTIMVAVVATADAPTIISDREVGTRKPRRQEPASLSCLLASLSVQILEFDSDLRAVDRGNVQPASKYRLSASFSESDE